LQEGKAELRPILQEPALRPAVVARQKGSAMIVVANLAVALVALLHLFFLVLEMFLWEKPLGLRTFGLTREFAKASKALAANQGLYNGFLVAGLVWGLFLGEPGNPIKIFFLSCVVVAGVFGAVTANRKILWIQALPGAIALVLVFLAS
jgi:putative membrane protein